MAAFLPAIAQAGASALGSFLSRSKPKPTPGQVQKQELLDELLASIKGQGRFSDLFQMDEAAFQRSYVDPAKSLFRQQIAPQIQQGFIAGGQQQGTGLEDTLSRAGVDLDQILNQQFAQLQQQAQQNQLSAIGGILGTESGLPGPGRSTGETILKGIGGSLQGGVGQQIGDVFSTYFNPSIQNPSTRKGFMDQQMSGITGGSRLG